MQVPLDTPKEIIQEKIDEVTIAYKTIKDNDDEERGEWLKSLAKAQVGGNRKKARTQYEQLIQREKQRED